MKRTGYHFYMIFGGIGAFLLFVLCFCYVFVSIGILAAGLIALPASLLGTSGIITVITDLAPLPLMFISGGLALLGIGMCLGIFTVCPASYRAFTGFLRKAEIKRKRVYDEE